MATLEQLEKRIVEADAAGRTEDVKILADEIRKRRAEQQVQTEQLVQPEELITAERLNVAKDIAADVGRSAVKGGVTGITGLAGLPALAEELSPTRRAVQYLPTLDPTLNLLKKLQERGTLTGKPGYLFPSQQQLMGLIEKIPQAEKVTQYEPKTTAGEYAETISEFVAPGGLFAKTAKTLGTAATIGGVGGTVQELQEQIGLSPLAALPLTLLSTLGAGYALSPSRAARYAKEAVKNIPDAELALAAKVERKANDLGINITAPELIDNKILQGVGQIVYGSDKGGEIMYNYIKNRPQEIDKVADALLDEIAKNPDSLRKIYKDAGTTAQKTLKDAKKYRSVISREKGYEVSNTESISEDQVLNVINQIDNEIGGLSKGPNLNKLLELRSRLIKKVVKPEEKIAFLDKTGKPIKTEATRPRIIPETNVNKLDSTFKEFRDAVRDTRVNQVSDRRFIDSNVARLLFNSEQTGILDNLNKQLRTNKNYAQAKDSFKQITEEVIIPVQDNLDVLLKNKITSSKIQGFIFDDTKNNVNDIKKTYKLLNKTDKNVFPNLARAFIKNAANKAFLIKPQGKSLKSGFNLYQALAGNKTRQANFNQILRGVAEANNVNPNNLLLGFNKFNEVLKRTAKLANVDNPKMPPDPRNLPQEVAQIGSFMWRVKFASRYGEFLKQRTMEDLAKIFTSKESVNELIKLSKTNLKSQEAVNRVINIVAASRPFNELQEEQVTQE